MSPTSTVTFSQGRLVVVDPRVFCPQREQLAEAVLERLSDSAIAFATCNLGGGRLEIRWADENVSAGSAVREFLAAFRRGREDEARPAWRRPLWSRQPKPYVASGLSTTEADVLPAAKGSGARGAIMVRGPKRLLYLLAGGGSTVMTFVGLLVPGIPTVPFLLASSYFFARSSRRAHAALLATPMFGTVVREWDAHEALSRASKRRLIVFTLVIISGTVVIAQGNPVSLVLVGVIAPLCVYSIVRLPEIKQPRLAMA
ncbi:MAG: YbaN family protein [Pirellulales bacterium]|jgi:uncharacterized membrane protein YbaN (DUF454 family)